MDGILPIANTVTVSDVFSNAELVDTLEDTFTASFSGGVLTLMESDPVQDSAFSDGDDMVDKSPPVVILTSTQLDDILNSNSLEEKGIITAILLTVRFCIAYFAKSCLSSRKDLTEFMKTAKQLLEMREQFQKLQLEGYKEFFPEMETCATSHSYLAQARKGVNRLYQAAQKRNALWKFAKDLSPDEVQKRIERMRQAQQITQIVLEGKDSDFGEEGLQRLMRAQQQYAQTFVDEHMREKKARESSGY